MTLSLLYPAWLPDLYYLACLLQADRIVLLDTEPYSRKGRVHRGKIRTPEGFQWLNIPVLTEDRSRPLRDVRIDHNSDWVEKHLRALVYNYRNSIYFDFYEPEIRADLEKAKEYERLVDFAAFFIDRLLIYLQLEVNMEWASRIPDFDRNPDIYAQKTGANKVFQEQNSMNYQWQSVYRVDPEFSHPVYPQHFGDFLPGMSLLDVIFQTGPSAYEVTDRVG